MYTENITIREKVGYSLGDVAANLVFQMIVVYQLKFYTDIFGLEGAIAGSILLIARVIDAFIDPAVGIMTDHTKTAILMPEDVIAEEIHENPRLFQLFMVAIRATDEDLVYCLEYLQGKKK